MPKNTRRQADHLPDINRADGFSPGNLIVTKIPEVETPAAFDNSGIVPLDDLRSTRTRTPPVMVIDAATGAPSADLRRTRREPDHQVDRRARPPASPRSRSPAVTRTTIRRTPTTST